MSLLELRGPVDPHVHLRDLDWSHKATFGSETAAALAGGYWAVWTCRTPRPPTTTARAAASEEGSAWPDAAYCDYGTWFGASGSSRHRPTTAAARRAAASG